MTIEKNNMLYYLDELNSKMDSLKSDLDNILKQLSVDDRKDNSDEIELPNHNLSNMARTQTFDNFRMDLFDDLKHNIKDNNESVKRNIFDIIKVSDIFMNELSEINGLNLLFYGYTGTGKTYLANCISNKIIDMGYTVRSYSAVDLFNFIGDTRFVKRNKNLDEYKMLTECDLLVIDDLGTELTNSFTDGELFNILNSRLLSGKKTIICTCLDLIEIRNKYSHMIFSRLVGTYKFTKFIGNDLRFMV